jgi:hypothetical protein
MRDEAAFKEFQEMSSEFEGGRSLNRVRMVGEIKALKLTYPGMEGQHGRINCACIDNLDLDA